MTGKLSSKMSNKAKRIVVPQDRVSRRNLICLIRSRNGFGSMKKGNTFFASKLCTSALRK